MADDEVTPLTTTTTNYGWVKPNVGASDDAWGGLLNADLDGIDSVVHGIDIRPSGGAIGQRNATRESDRWASCGWIASAVSFTSGTTTAIPASG